MTDNDTREKYEAYLRELARELQLIRQRESFIARRRKREQEAGR